MSLFVKSLRYAVCTVAAVALCTQLASAQASYPSKPITLSVLLAAGGVTDLAARAIAADMSAKLGQQVVVDNKTGGGGVIGAGAVARSAPDGYNVCFCSSGPLTLLPAQRADLPLKPEDLEPVIRLYNVDLFIVARADSAVKTLPQLIEAARAKPDQVSYGHTGAGTITHMGMELLASKAGVKMRHVPYRGGAPLMLDLIGGQIEFGVVSALEAVEHRKAGKINVLASMGVNPFPAMPDVPTVSKFYPGYVADSWAGLFVPKGTPAEVKARLRKAAEEVIATDSMKANYAKFGVTPVNDTSPEPFAKYMVEERARWTELMKVIGPIPTGN